jgi:hypothetical protein
MHQVYIEVYMIAKRGPVHFELDPMGRCHKKNRCGPRTHSGFS